MKRHIAKIKWFYVAITIYGLFHISLWIAQFHLPYRAPTGTGYLVNAIQSIFFWIVALAVISVKKFRPFLTSLLLVFVFSLLTQFFAYIYWSYGTIVNFNMPLSHLDALYFALGTLTTAGTGSVVAISETARRLQLLQMILDSGLILISVGLFVARFASYHAGPQRNTKI